MKERWGTTTQGLRYVVSGKDGSVALLFLHGMGGSIHNWRLVRQRLDSATPYILLELPGHGLSNRGVVPKTLTGAFSLVEKAVEELWSGDLVIVGHSLGAYAALRLGIRNTRVRRICLLSGHLFSVSRVLRQGPREATDFRLAFNLLRALVTVSTPPATVVRRLLNTSDLARRVILEPFLSAKRLTNATRAGDCFREQGGVGAIRMLALATKANMEEIASRCQVPVCLVSGDQDPLMASRDHDIAPTVLNLTDARLVSRCGHWPHIEVPDLVVESVRKALSEV